MASRKKFPVLFIASEMTPFAKTGGLADVVASLAAHLRLRDHDVRVVMPMYSCVRTSGAAMKRILKSMCVTMGNCEEWCSLHQAKDKNGTPVIFVEHNLYFDRVGLYHDRFMNDYLDNPRRFAFLCRAALQYCLDCGFTPQIVHAHDWQAALAPAYMKAWFWNTAALGRAASVLTIHNIAYQGAYPAAYYSYLGLGPQNFTDKIFESWGAVSFLKGGIHFSDAVNTVSPTHAREITEPFGGFGLAPYLADKGTRFTGILNGVDYSIWSPENDAAIPYRFSVRDLGGKALCKQALQDAFGLERAPAVCLIATVGRFVEQKGFNLIRSAIERILDDTIVQFVILGDGDEGLRRFFGRLPSRYPGQSGSYIGYNWNLAHLVEAGADFFLMPSLYEPCGLNQLYSLRYGTLPIVRATGGLEDTVEQYNERTGDGTGFKFSAPTPGALYDTVGWAVSTYYDRPHHMQKLIRRAMRRDFSWRRSVLKYERLYRNAIQSKMRYDAAHTL